MRRRVSLFVFWCWAAAAQPRFYLATQDVTARPGSGNLVAIINPLTGATSEGHLTLDAEGNPVQMFDIAVDPRGGLWGLDHTQSLWKIDGATGLSTKMAERLTGGPNNINGMTFEPGTGDLYFSGNEAGVFRLNVATCDGTQCAPLVDMSKPPYPSNTCAGDIEFHQGDLYFAGEFGILYRLKRDTDGLWYAATESAIVSIGLGTAFVMKGLASDGETLYVAGDTNQAPAPQYVAVVDTETLSFSKPVPITGTGATLVTGLGIVPSPRNAPPALPGLSGAP